MGPAIQVKMEMHTFVCFFVWMWAGWILGTGLEALFVHARASALPLSQLQASPIFKFLINVFLSLENISNSKKKRKCVYILESGADQLTERVPGGFTASANKAAICAPSS